MIAAATMYEVSTQVIWSCVAESDPWMCGSATLAIVLSSACMIEASITETVIRPRCGPSTSGAPHRRSAHRGVAPAVAARVGAAAA